MSFVDLGLKPELLRAVDEKGYSEATPIQAKAIPAVLGGSDVLAGAQTGTGKTAAFVLPILQRLGQAAGPAPRALVLTPTRELAAQVAESAQVYGKYVGLRTVVVFGGVSINPQIDALEYGCDLLVATPGRLLDLAEQGVLDLRSVQCFVLDEADRMLDMGFIHAIRRILKLLPQQRQNLLFSATYSDDIRALAARILRNPANIEVAPRNATADRVDQQIYRVPKDHKRHLLAHLIDDGNWHQVLVFTRTKHGANRLAQQLESNGILAAAIHGNKSQGARVRALSDFKANKITALVATEVAARGLDIKELPHVVNYELPNVPEDYVHRIGRTARAGGTGSAVSLVSPDEGPLLKDIERLLRRTLPVAALPQFPIVVAHGRGGRQSHSRDAELESGVEFESGVALDGADEGADVGQRGERHGEAHGQRAPRRDDARRDAGGGHFGRRDAGNGQRSGRGNKAGEGRGRRFGQRGAGQPGQDQGQRFGQRGESRGDVSGRQFDQRNSSPRQFDGRGDQQQRGYRGDAPHGGEQRDGGRQGSEQRGEARQYGQGGEQRGDARNGESRHNGQGGQQRGVEQRGDVRHHGRHVDQRGGGRHFGHAGEQRGRPGRHAPNEGGQGRGDSRRGRPAQPSRGFSGGNRDQRRREGGGPGGRR